MAPAKHLPQWATTDEGSICVRQYRNMNEVKINDKNEIDKEIKLLETAVHVTLT